MQQETMPEGKQPLAGQMLCVYDGRVSVGHGLQPGDFTLLPVAATR
jgi:hypothetical protein